MAANYEPPPPAYDDRVADADDIKLQSKPGSVSYVNNGNNAEPGSSDAADVDKSQV